VGCGAGLVLLLLAGAGAWMLAPRSREDAGVGGVTFQSPGWLWLLVAVPLLAAAGVMWVRGARRARERWADPALIALAHRAAPRRTARAPSPPRWRWPAWPRRWWRLRVRRSSTPRGGGAQHGGSDGRRVASMNRTDLAPSRLVAAVDAAGRFLDQAPAGTSIGLVAFARNARGLVAPTLDHGRVRARAGDARHHPRPHRAWRGAGHRARLAAGGGAVPATPGIRCVHRAAPGAHRRGRHPARLATTPADAAERAAADGIPIFTIRWRRPRGGRPHAGETLAAIATRTGGVFTQTATTPDLRAVFSDLGSVITPVERLRELTVWWAAAALVLLLCAALVGALAAAGNRCGRVPPGAR